MRQEFLGRLGRALRNWFDEEARHEQLPRAWSSLLSRFKRKHELQEELREPPNQSLSASSGGAKPRAALAEPTSDQAQTNPTGVSRAPSAPSAHDGGDIESTE
jgi:hypothetical protein